jgi:5-methylcytosine-specific restriction endonuclease McrBC GTP-binding regulatory subunit McrB
LPEGAADPDREYVFIIDEINRGNLSQIFGELLMLSKAISGRQSSPSIWSIATQVKRPSLSRLMFT